MASLTPNTILLRGSPNRREFDAGGAITPGHLLQLDPDGDVTVHSVAGGASARMFAVENDIAGDGIEHAYADQEVCQVHVGTPGDEVLAWLADGENVAIGDFLSSAGAGQLRKHTGDSATSDLGAIAMALEALDLTATTTLVATRIKVLIV